MGLHSSDPVVKAFQELSPCEVITPIDCFSDGAELLHYKRDYAIDDPDDVFDWKTYPILGEKKGKPVYLNKTYKFDVFDGLVGYSQKPKISEVENVSKVLEHGCQRIVGQGSK